jgi:hypothetical protein
MSATSSPGLITPGWRGSSSIALRTSESCGSPAPARITLGSDAYSYVHTALSERLADLEAQKDLAFSTDYPAGARRARARSHQAAI